MGRGGQLLIPPPALKRRGSPRRQGLCSHLAHKWASFDFAPPLSSGGAPQGGRGYVATVPTCGPLLILPAPLKWRGSPRRQGLCCPLAHKWATSNSAPALKRWGSPRRQGLCSHLAHLWATSNSTSRCEAVGLPDWQGLSSHLAHLWSTSNPVPRYEAEGIPRAAPEKARVRQPLLIFFLHPPDGQVAARAVPHLHLAMLCPS